MVVRRAPRHLTHYFHGVFATRANPRALMRGQGAVVVGRSIMEAAARSVYMRTNARLHSQAMALSGDITYLNAEEVAKLAAPNWYDRAWEMWKRKVRGK